MPDHDPAPGGMAAVAGAVPGHDGYAAAGRRAATEKRVRAVAARRAREGRDAVAAAGRRLAAAGSFGALPAVEGLVGRIQRFADRLDQTTLGYGAWLADTALTEAAREGLTALDRDLLAAVDDGVAALQTLRADPAHAAADAAMLGAFVDGWHALLDGRRAVLEAPVPPAAPPPASVMAAAVGGRVAILGEAHAVTGRWRWDRGDRALVLGDSGAGLRLWEDVGGDRVLFEAQPIPVDVPPPETVATAEETFTRRWSDDGGALVRDAGGVRRAAGERWWYAGDAGGRLWVERAPDGARVWRGLPLDGAEAAVI